MSARIALRPYQVEAIEAIHGAWRRGVRRPLLHMATGLGKTIVFAELTRRHEGRVLIVVHREELLQQAVEKLRMVAGDDMDIGLVRAESDDHDHRVVVASVQTLARPNRLERVAADFGLVVVDECHHATADSYRRLLEHFGGALALGVTATPERADSDRLSDVWAEIVYSKGLAEAVQERYLSDLRGQRVELEVDMDAVHTRGGDYIESEAAAAYLSADAPRYALEAYQEHAAGRKALAFTSGVDMAHEFARAFAAAGISAAAIDAQTPREDRRSLLNAFRRGDIRVMANCGVLTEGFDEPSVDCLIIARPTKSRPLYVQMIGRGTRRHPGKDDCLVIDLVGVSRRHDLVSVGSAFDVEVDAGESLVEAMEREAAGRQHAERLEVDGRLVSREVALLASELHWGTQPDLYVLAAGDEGQVVLREESDGWAVWHVGRDSERKVASALTMDYAQGTAEDLVRRLGGSHLASRGAGWRQRTASIRQLTALRNMGVAMPATITAGQACDAMSAAIARRALEPATDKQRWRLRYLGAAVEPGLTKRQAQRTISRLLGQRVA